MTDSNERYKVPKPRRKPAPVKRVTVGADAKRAYEELVRQRDEKERTYGRHLGDDGKGKR